MDRETGGQRVCCEVSDCHRDGTPSGVVEYVVRDVSKALRYFETSGGLRPPTEGFILSYLVSWLARLLVSLCRNLVVFYTNKMIFCTNYL